MPLLALLALLALILFTAYTTFSILQAEQSLLQFGIQLMSSLDTAQVVIDLYLLAALACIWMYHDNKSRGKSFLSVAPYLLTAPKIYQRSQDERAGIGGANAKEMTLPTKEDVIRF